MEYNAKTRICIWGCFLLMLLVLVLLGAVALYHGTGNGRGANGGANDAIYVDAPIEALGTLPPETTEPMHSTTAESVSAGETPTQEQRVNAPRKPRYYVTLSKGNVILLDEKGEYLETLNENADFLPKNDLERLSTGIALYDEDELAAMKDDLS